LKWPLSSSPLSDFDLDHLLFFEKANFFHFNRVFALSKANIKHVKKTGGKKESSFAPWDPLLQIRENYIIFC